MVGLVGLVVGFLVGWLDGWLVWWLDCNSKLETEIGEAGLGSYDAGNRHPLVSQTFRLNLTSNLSQNFNLAFFTDFIVEDYTPSLVSAMEGQDGTVEEEERAKPADQNKEDGGDDAGKLA